MLHSDGASVDVADSGKGVGVGSVLVDYFVELTDVGRRVDTQEMKRLFHNSLSADPDAVSSRLQLGSFLVDPKSTDFIGKLTDSLGTDASVDSDGHLDSTECNCLIGQIKADIVLWIHLVQQLINVLKSVCDQLLPSYP